MPKFGLAFGSGTEAFLSASRGRNVVRRTVEKLIGLSLVEEMRLKGEGQDARLTGSRAPAKGSEN